MSPGVGNVCVTSFRMLMRHSDLGHFRRCGLHLTPVGTISVNSWVLRGRRNISYDKNKQATTISSGRTKLDKALQKKIGMQQSSIEITTKRSYAKPMRHKLNEVCPDEHTAALSTRESNEHITAAVEVLKSNTGTTANNTNNNVENNTNINTSNNMVNYIEDKTFYTNTPTATNEGVDSDEDDTDELHGEVTVEYIQGLPHLTVPLPSRNEKCRFTLMPVSHKVGDFIEMLKEEDRGIDRASVLNNYGIRIASTCTIESLMNESFWLQINNKKYQVVPPERKKIPMQDIHKLSDVRTLVAQLYEALHVGEHHIQKEQELAAKLEQLKYQIKPLESKKSELSGQAERKIGIMTWMGLGLMSVQFGILARLTWWEYSWDIMEPVTYFVTYGTAMAMYAYYCITKTEYNFPEIKNRVYLLNMHKRAKKKELDIDEYNKLKREIAETEYDLRRLRDPLNLQLPPHVERDHQHTAPPTIPPPAAEKIQIKASRFSLPFVNTKN